MSHFRLDYFLEPYAELINTALPCALLLILFMALAVHFHIISHVTPRVDAFNGYKTCRRFKINRHQTALYRHCFTANDQRIQRIFKAHPVDKFLFRCDKYMGPVMIVLTTVSGLFLRYTYTLMF